MVSEDNIFIISSLVLSVVGSSYVVGNMLSKRLEDLKESLCDNLSALGERISRLEDRHFKD